MLDIAELFCNIHDFWKKFETSLLEQDEDAIGKHLLAETEIDRIDFTGYTALRYALQENREDVRARIVSARGRPASL